MELLLALIDRQGFATRAEALDLGVTDKVLTAERRAERLTRFRHGTYTTTSRWRALDAEGRHLLRLRAVIHRLGGEAVASHASAALLHGLPVWGVPLDRVHLTRVDDVPGRRQADVTHHVGRLDPGDVVEAGGVPCVGPTRAAIETGLLGTPASFLPTADALLHAGLATRADLGRTWLAMERWPDRHKLSVAVRLADGAAESVGESRLRWILWGQGLPTPVLQYEVVDPDSDFRAYCDLAWPEHGVVLEFDGFVKYGRLLRPGQSVADVLVAEKRREDRIRELTGWTVIRVVWADLEHPTALVARVRRALGLAAA